MLDWLKNNATAAREKLALEVSKFRNREFMEAVVAGCALVAAADGDINSREKQKMIGFIQNSNELKVFDLQDVIKAFTDICLKFEFDAEIGRAEALRTVCKLRGKDDAARLLVRVCCAIGNSDGEFDESERAVCRTICAELGLSPDDFGL
ncbi:tellurite resistance protein TerB [Azotobacter beijerinckii]|uniref:Tellurite resistance protein TerB n=1 Tax=Azotobacter beijerinckii TaxID=170623 RepID=A0A1H6R8P2_9GAMM|nr:tellurite resistance TerB family protein [Azotobacter beijerinckii]SEI52199.1 tellurite resistance protein TerB [Azotobacter beijerinckii]SEI81446.1 tellurite resistance protein TerB [Azotobacter beijerinckii]SEQ44028.1 tellurite resistance protein TerB [Azotobacter beijerinckii]